MNSIIEPRYDPKTFETEIYNASKFTTNLDKNDHEYFSILMPPPNVTGSLHLGHALTYTLQDILVRYHRQRKIDTYWQPGLDHAGIATQLVVEKWLESKNINYHELSYDDFIKKVWEWKSESATNIVAQQKALGCAVDWQYSRFTMDGGFTQAVTEAFVRLYNDGLIYKSQRLVNWDTKLETAISDLEIKNVDEQGTLWYINYQIDDSFITVATTRPETMFGDTALAVNPNDTRYQNFIGKFAIIPYTDRRIPIIADEHADIEKGSGCVKITPAHDFNDFEVGKRHNLDCISVLDKRGHMLSQTSSGQTSSEQIYIPEWLRGLYVKKARKCLLERLRNDDLLVKEETIQHNVPYGDRSGTVIEPMITEQWFLDAAVLAKKAISVVESGEVKFYPDKWKNTFFDWMKNIQPWCISRQIKWGHRIPAWYGENGEIIVAKDLEEAEKIAKSKNIQNLTAETDVLDTWFSSALWPFATMGWPNTTSELLTHELSTTCKLLDKYFPTKTLVTGFDIIFFWVSRMLMMSLYFMNKIPFKDIYIHALVRDEKGQKMSKSKGNVINPLELMNEFGADALRYTLTYLSVPGRDIKFGYDNVKISRNFITKIWNAGRFLQTQDVKFNVQKINPTHKLHFWILDKLKQFSNGIESDIKEYRFDYIAHRMQSFLRDQFCDFFIEAIKIINDEETKNIAGFVYTEFLKLSYPVIPFITEHLLQVLNEQYTLVPVNISSITNTSINNNENAVNNKVNNEIDSESEIDNEVDNEIDDFIVWLHDIRAIKKLHGPDSEEYKTALSKANFSEQLKPLLALC